MASIFSKIVAGEIPCYKIAENARYFAFLDVFPLMHGHTLGGPKKETDRIFDLSEQELAGILEFARPIANAIEKAFPCARCGIAVIGLEVPHAHVHLVPIDSADDLNFTRPKLKPGDASLKESQEKLLQALQQNL